MLYYLMKMILPMIFMMMCNISMKNMLVLMCLLLTSLMTLYPFFMPPTFWNMFMFSDQISFILLMLTLMSLVMIMLSSSSYTKMLFIMLSINTSLILTFMSSNTLLFYILFETVLIPTIILIIKKGMSPERTQAGIYLLMYTIFGSLPLLAGLLWNSSLSSFFILSELIPEFKLPLMFMMAFLIKLPVFFFHLWLPKAHVEAPLEGSMILAAVLLKLGGYGLIRMSPSIHSMPHLLIHFLISTSLLGAIFTSLTCLRQKDLKSLIAYSSISHMGLVLASLMTFKSIGLMSAIMMMFAHGLSSSALFFLVTIIYSNNHTRNILSFKGLLIIMPNLTFWFFMFTAINISAPPSINMISEILIITSLLQMDNLNLIILFVVSITVTSFSIYFYSNINHNTFYNINMNINPSPKSYLSLLNHFTPLIILSLKPELMIL